jgi:hypothetical protein
VPVAMMKRLSRRDQVPSAKRSLRKTVVPDPTQIFTKQFKDFVSESIRRSQVHMSQIDQFPYVGPNQYPEETKLTKKEKYHQICMTFCKWINKNTSLASYKSLSL